MFDNARPASLIAVACAMPDVDCALGVATWGHSQGGLVAAVAHNFEPRVRAAWTTGYGGDGNPTLAQDRRRLVNGESDASGARATLDAAAGFSATDCPDDADQCLRDNGSGWILVRKADLAKPAQREAGHCWFDRDSCTANDIVLEPNWVSTQSTKPFALEENADWLAETAQRP